jgi:cbb3-type cytochrome oxidase maturation protein
MFASTVILILLSLFLGAGAWLVFIWAMQRGEFDDVEGPKHRMLDDDPPSRRQDAQNDDHDDGR